MGVYHVIMRTAAGGGNRVWPRAPSGERIPLPVRGDGLPYAPPQAATRRHRGECGSARPAGVTWGEL